MLSLSIKAKYSPENRFKNFSEHWKSAKLVDLCEINSKTSGNLPDQFYYIDLESVNQGVLSDEIELLNRLEAPSRAQRLLEKGDVLYQTVRPYQRNNYLFNFDNTTEFVASTGYAVLKPRKVNSQFLYQIMNTDKFTKEVMARTTGTSFPAISPRDLAEIVIKLPSQKEQKKIGNFLSVIDNLINLKEKKIKKQKEIKSAYLSEMFPKEGEKYPKKRFEGFTNPWKEFSLEQVAKIRTGYPFNSNEFTNDGKYLVITNGNIQTSLPIVDSSAGNRITIKDPRIVDEYVLNDGDILVTMDGTVGRTAKVIEKNQILAQRVGRLTAYENSEFLYQALQTGSFYKNMSLIGHGGTIKHISLSEIGSYKITMPDSKEQNKVAEFFKNLDNQISIEEEKLSKLEKLKRAYLNDLFVKKQ